MTGDAALRAELEAALLDEVERIGPEGFKKDALVKRFMGRGTGRSTLYRWADAILASGKPGQHLAKRIKAAAADRAARTPDPARAAAVEVVERLPVRVSPCDMTGTIPVIARLQECLQVADDLMKHARTPSGDVRNAKLLLNASEHLRRSLETATRLYEAMRQVDQVDKFHGIILEEIGKLAPETAEAIVTRMGNIATEWGG